MVREVFFVRFLFLWCRVCCRPNDAASLSFFLRFLRIKRYRMRGFAVFFCCSRVCLCPIHATQLPNEICRWSRKLMFHHTATDARVLSVCFHLESDKFIRSFLGLWIECSPKQVLFYWRLLCFFFSSPTHRESGWQQIEASRLLGNCCKP